MKPILRIKAGIVFALIAVSAALLFVPVADGAGDVKAMFLMLTGLAVRDFFGSVSADKRVQEVKDALNPAPPSSYVAGDEE